MSEENNREVLFTLKNVYKAYQGNPVLDIASCVIYREPTAVLGYSGAGKSTLLFLLGLLDDYEVRQFPLVLPLDIMTKIAAGYIKEDGNNKELYDAFKQIGIRLSGLSQAEKKEEAWEVLDIRKRQHYRMATQGKQCHVTRMADHDNLPANTPEGITDNLPANTPEGITYYPRPSADGKAKKPQGYQKLKEREKIAMRKEQFGFIFQESYLLAHLSALHNCAMPVKLSGKPGLQEAETLFRRIFDREFKHFKHEKDFRKNVCNKKPRSLSGGQRQRVAIARALVHKPGVILGDELTGNLDPDTADNVLDLITEICNQNGSSLILITHNFEQAFKYCQRYILLRDGCIIGDHRKEPLASVQKGSSNSQSMSDVLAIQPAFHQQIKTATELSELYR